jgi:hypothetical protein
MIFKTFDPEDIVSGRTTKVASGFWPDGATNISASSFVDNWNQLVTTAAPSPSYGTSIYDVRKTMYYIDVYPSSTYYPNDPYFSISYGHIAGDVGSGSFDLETGSIMAHPTKTVYTQYKNMLLGSADIDGKFSFLTGSSTSAGGIGTVNADDIYVFNFSTYKMKDRIDEGIFEITISGSGGTLTLRDDSPYQSQTLNVYNLIEGSISQPISDASSISYKGVGLIYPQNGVVVFNASKLNQLVGGLTSSAALNYVYNPRSNQCTINSTVNPYVLFDSIKKSNSLMKVRKSEYVPSRHYFVRVKNRDFNYSNNPTYVYDGTDGMHSKGTILNKDFINDPKTYITTVGLYNDQNELVAVAKLSRPAVKSFDNELNLKIRLDF